MHIYLSVALVCYAGDLYFLPPHFFHRNVGPGSDGLFLYLSHYCRFIGTNNPETHKGSHCRFTGHTDIGSIVDLLETHRHWIYCRFTGNTDSGSIVDLLEKHRHWIYCIFTGNTQTLDLLQIYWKHTDIGSIVDLLETDTQREPL